MATIEAKHLFKVFGPAKRIEKALDLSRKGNSVSDIAEDTGCTVAVRDVSFTVEGPEIFVIMGLSGSGKSTLLRCINRLIEPSRGELSIDGEDVLGLDHKEVLHLREKKVAMVFQHFGLLSHRSVLENAAFGLELSRVPEEDRNRKAMEALELVGLESNADARVGELSGGMQQRVGLARALATDAEILLMDEPFSALDPLIRSDTQDELLKLQEKMPKTILFITHDLGEALRLGQRVAIMKDGAVVQIGAPQEIVLHPEDDYVSAFVENVDRSRVLSVAIAAGEKAPSVAPDAAVDDALQAMERGESDAVFVLEDGRVKGLVRRGDARQQSREENPRLDAVLRDAPEAVHPDEPIFSLLDRASETPDPIPVIDGEGRLEGYVTQGRLLRAIAGGRS